jgi:hypothetical protein
MIKSLSLKKLYFTLVSIAWIIWMLFGYGNLIYTTITSYVISDQEYIAWSYSYEIKECENLYPKSEWQIPKTPQEIQECKQQAQSTILQRRAYDKKTSIINWIVRWTLFLILFVTHFPFMLKKEE